MDRASIPLGSSCTAKGKEGGRCARDSHPFPPGSLLPHCNMKGGKRGTSNLLGPQCTAEKKVRVYVCVEGGTASPSPQVPSALLGERGAARPLSFGIHTQQGEPGGGCVPLPRVPSAL